MADALEPLEGHVQLLLPRAPVHARRLPRRLSPTLDEIWLSDPAEAWSALGFTVDGSVTGVGRPLLRFVAGEGGFDRWSLRGIASTDFDGVATVSSDAPEREPRGNPNGVGAIDHVVVATPDFARTAAKLAAAGLALRRTREAGSGRQGFYVIGDCVLELVGPLQPDGAGPAGFWGITFVVDDIDALALRLGPLLGTVRDAVQPGRRIATLRPEAGLGAAVAFITPRAPRVGG